MIPVDFQDFHARVLDTLPVRSKMRYVYRSLFKLHLWGWWPLSRSCVVDSLSPTLSCCSYCSCYLPNSLVVPSDSRVDRWDCTNSRCRSLAETQMLLLLIEQWRHRCSPFVHLISWQCITVVTTNVQQSLIYLTAPRELKRFVVEIAEFRLTAHR